METATVVRPHERQASKELDSTTQASKHHEICARYLPSQIENGVIVMFARPAAGKGTQAEILSNYLGIPTISTGHLLRERAKAGDALGQEIDAIQRSGEFVSSAIVFELLEKHLEALGNPKAFILDGCPRIAEQVAMLDQLLKSRGIQNLAVLQLEVSLETALERSSKRGRSDDDPVSVKNRFAKFEADTEPLSALYLARRELIKVAVDSSDLSLNVDAVANTLAPRLASWTENPITELKFPRA